MSRYYNSEGRYQDLWDEKYAKLVPSWGEAKTRKGNVLIAASKAVNRRYNDGDSWDVFMERYSRNYGAAMAYLNYSYTRVDYDNMIDSILKKFWPKECKKIGGVSNKKFDYNKKYGIETFEDRYYTTSESESD